MDTIEVRINQIIEEAKKEEIPLFIMMIDDEDRVKGMGTANVDFLEWMAGKFIQNCQKNRLMKNSPTEVQKLLNTFDKKQ